MKPTFFDSSILPVGSLSRRHALKLMAGMAAPFACLPLQAAANRRVVVWSEGTAPDDKVYPQDINTAVAIGLRELLPDWTVETANLQSPEQGCSETSLKNCDVLIWWGHKKHGDVKDAYVDRVVRRVKEEGMGMISLHSSHFAKVNKRLMGTACSWGAYENDGCTFKVHVANPAHPIAQGVKDFTLPKIERYSEPYAVPTPEAVPLDGVYVYPDGHEEKARMGLCWTVGKGRMFYLAAGHETCRDFYMDEIKRVMANAVLWTARVT